MKTSDLPTYLDPPRVVAGRTYGKLIRRDRDWIIEGEPMVVQLAKRLFPGTRAERGHARFPLSKRLVPDLNWLMQRYPLEVVDQEAWNAAHREAVAHVRKSIEIRARPEAMHPGATFAGKLKPFQERGVAWMAHHRRTLLADEMGLGKTVQALAFLAAIEPKDAFPCLLVVQPHMVRQWRRMIDTFLPGVTHIALEGLKPSQPLPHQVTLVHYGIVRAWGEWLRGEFRTVIFDEVQELRRSGSQKYTACSVLADGAENAIGLSGTPIHNAGAEIWNVLNILETHCLGDWHAFTQEWCHGYGSEQVADPEVLGAHLREQGLLLRRTKDEVLPELPAKRRCIEQVDADSDTFGELMGPVLEKLPLLEQSEDHLERGRMREQIINGARMATGVAKAPHVADFVAALLEAGEPGVVFAHHHAVTDTIVARLKARGLGRVVAIDGRTTQADKDAALKAMVSGDADCAVLSLRTTAGIDGLQRRCRWCVFAELDWSPAVHSQAEDRLHRIGLPDSVLAYYLVYEGPGSTDPDIMSRLGFKASQFVGLMGDTPEGPEAATVGREKATEHMKRVIERLQALGGRGARAR